MEIQPPTHPSPRTSQGAAAARRSRKLGVVGLVVGVVSSFAPAQDPVERDAAEVPPTPASLVENAPPALVPDADPLLPSGDPLESPLPTALPRSGLPDPLPTGLAAGTAGTATLPDPIAQLDLAVPKPNQIRREGTPEGELAGAIDEGQLNAEGAARTPVPEERLEDRRRRKGPLQLSLDVGVGYDDNIFLSATEKVEDYIYAISPAVQIGLGDAVEQSSSYLIINYDPTALFFQNSPDENAVDHDIATTVSFRSGKSGVTAKGRFQTLSGSVQDIGDRAERSVTTASLGFSYGWGRKVSVDTTIQYEDTNYEEFIDTTSYRAELAVAYEATPKTSVAVGVAAGRVEISGGGSDQDFTQLFFSAVTSPRGKLAFRGRAGADFRRSPAGDRVTPIFALGATYRPAGRTTIRLDGQRDVFVSSADVGTDYTETRLVLGLEQKVGRRWAFALDLGYEELAYEAVAANVVTDREDSAYFVRPSASYTFRENLSGSLYYTFRDNSSTSDSFRYTNNQAGLELGYEF